MTDPADCGPVCLAFCQDVQAEAYDYPESFFAPQGLAHPPARARPGEVGGGRRRDPRREGAGDRGRRRRALFRRRGRCWPTSPRAHNIPVVETQAGKSALTPGTHPLNFGSPGVTGSACGNAACEAADLVIGVGTRFQDFTTGSGRCSRTPTRRLVSINVAAYDAYKHGALARWSATRRSRWQAIGAALGTHRFAAADARPAHATGTPAVGRGDGRARGRATRCPPTRR